MRSGNDVERRSSSDGPGDREPGAEKPIAEPTGAAVVSPEVVSARLAEAELAKLVEAAESRAAARVLPEDLPGKGSRRR